MIGNASKKLNLVRDRSGKYAIVTVAYEHEYDLLLLQARSMALFCDPDLVDRIIVIDNSAAPFSQKQITRLRSAYAGFALEILPALEISSIPASVDGWTRQQVLKLRIAASVHTERYLILDAKNHLISQLKRDFLESDDGRSKIRRHSYMAHPMLDQLKRTLEFFDIDQTSSHLTKFTPTVTPFVMYTEIARALIAKISDVTSDTFECAFLSNRLSEFIAYGAFVIKYYDFDELYADQDDLCPIIWGHLTNVDECLWAINLCRTRQLPFFSIHRQAFKSLSKESQLLIADFWASSKLFVSAEEAQSFLAQMSKNRSTWHVVLVKFMRRLVRKMG